MSISVSGIAQKVLHLLSGEPLRAINYGAIAVVYVTVKVAVALGYMTDAPDFDGIAVGVAAAIAAITELARRLVYSPNTVDAIIAEKDEDIEAVRSQREAAEAV